ncbi:MAG: GAF domain-containing protein [Polyangiaceae bacterium]|nr:GAF domain-containing protein [Polyangiaceae bacterium]
MTRSRARGTGASNTSRQEGGAAPLIDDAFEALLSSEESGEPVSEERLIERALSGHSPSARALANAGDTVVALAESAALPAPSTSLRDRILRDVAGPPTRKSEGLPPVKPLPFPAERSSPSEAVARIHARLPTEPRRVEVIDRLGMRGGPGQEATDRALYLLIDQYSPFLGFELVFVSTVVGDVTIHRVHRGFPAHLGNLEIVPRELSFCTHTVSSGEPFIVEDAAKEAFFRQSDLVQKLGARAYLGVPLFDGDIAVGALCGISSQPQVIFPEDIALAQRFATIAQALVRHDEAELARLIVEPDGYPGAAGEGRPVVLSNETFSGIVEAQRQRLGVADTTWLVRVDKDEWASVASGLPPTLVTGALGEDAQRGDRGILVPEEHPGFDALAGLARKGERLG